MTKAISLFSGGLDSILATKLILNQNICVEAVYFHNPFCDCSSPNASCKAAESLASALGIPFHKIELRQDYLKIIKNPKHGYGKNMNPCIDCRMLQFKKAKALLKKFKASFIITGEVVGERPMSQNKNAMLMIDNGARVNGIILRPLSAKSLKETEPETRGYVDREKLLNIQGRSRKIQIALAKEFGIGEYPTPSGGCLLTYAGFSQKVRDLIKYNQLTLSQVSLLKIGRQFRLDNKAKLIVGRDEQDNNRIESIKKQGVLFLKAKDLPGPTGALIGARSKKLIALSASIIAYYINKTQSNTSICIEYWHKDPNSKKTILADKASAETISHLRIT